MALRDLLDLVLPLECGACQAPGSRWCARCASALAATGFPGGPRRVLPEPAPPGLPSTHAWGPYAGPLRPAIAAWKDAGRGDLARVLGPLLSAAVCEALAAAGWAQEPVLLLTAPSSRRSRRQRGEVPLERLLIDIGGGLAARGCGTVRVACRVLEHARAVVDQAGLGTVSRAVNLSGAVRVSGRWQPVVQGRRCLVVDDVMTTGATLAECSRALREAGASAVEAATIGATERRSPTFSGRHL
ncbi:MAG TPA: phosphoribosyltransferase family protein [Dermatophilaceae bacterium]|nr:phosphoribosyltransferase family protein [Dermatophilaceae bacterium]